MNGPRVIRTLAFAVAHDEEQILKAAVESLRSGS